MMQFWQFIGAEVHTLVGLLDDVGDISSAIVVILAIIKASIHLVRQRSRPRFGKRTRNTTPRAQHHQRGQHGRRRHSSPSLTRVSMRHSPPRHGVRRKHAPPDAASISAADYLVSDAQRPTPMTLEHLGIE